MIKDFIALLHLPSEIVMVFVYLVWVMVLFVIKRIGMTAIRRFTAHTRTPLDDLFIESVNWPLIILILTSGGFVSAHVLSQEVQDAFLKNFHSFFKASAIVAGVIFANKFLLGFLREYTPKIEILRDTSGILQGAVRIVVFGLGALVLLDSFGVSITPIIASLGIGSLAIALALQPTLENLFAGIQLVVDKPIQLGHFIRLETGDEGYVERIGWRTTWVRLPPNNMVIIPNKNLVNAKILNYYYPDREMAVLVEVGVHYDSDLEKVERVTLAVARETLRETPEGVKTFEPVVRFHTLGDFSINMTVVLRAAEVTQAPLLKHDFIKRLHRRYSQEGIVIPYPVQAVNYSQEKADGALGKDR